MLTRLAQIMLFAHGVQCLVGRQAAIQAAPGSITSKRRLRPGSLVAATRGIFVGWISPEDGGGPEPLRYVP